MERFSYGLNDGSIYKKIDKAVYTYIYCSNVKDFLHYIMGNLEVADQIAGQINSINELLSHHNCRIIKQIEIDYNFIEVNDGFCFNIEKKLFEKEPAELKG